MRSRSECRRCCAVDLSQCLHRAVRLAKRYCSPGFWQMLQFFPYPERCGLDPGYVYSPRLRGRTGFSNTEYALRAIADRWPFTIVLSGLLEVWSILRADSGTTLIRCSGLIRRAFVIARRVRGVGVGGQVTDQGDVE